MQHRTATRGANRQRFIPADRPYEPPSTPQQKSEITHLRQQLQMIPWKHKTMRWCKPGQPIPETSREADRLIRLLWRLIERRLDKLPKWQRPRFHSLDRQLQARNLNATVERIEGKFGPGSITTAQRLSDAL